MRMIFTDDVTHNAGGLLVRPVIGIGQLGLRKKNAPVHGLQAVAGIGNGTPDDDRQRIFQIGFAQFPLDIDFGLFRHVCLVDEVSGA